jgi:hypothetical protein
VPAGEQRRQHKNALKHTESGRRAAIREQGRPSRRLRSSLQEGKHRRQAIRRAGRLSVRHGLSVRCNASIVLIPLYTSWIHHTSKRFTHKQQYRRIPTTTASIGALEAGNEKSRRCDVGAEGGIGRPKASSRQAPGSPQRRVETCRLTRTCVIFHRAETGI